MKGYLILDKERLGEINFAVIDESMGGIGGQLIPFPEYEKYKEKIQSICDKKGIANIDDFEFSIILNDNTILEPEGGIGVTDVKGFDEIYVESAGIHYEIINKIAET